jgi:hypothetical protein
MIFNLIGAFYAHSLEWNGLATVEGIHGIRRSRSALRGTLPSICTVSITFFAFLSTMDLASSF